MPWKDALRRLVGAPYLLKRLQLPRLLVALDLKEHETALDLGCNLGMLTREMGRRCRRAVGLDVMDVGGNVVPRDLEGRVEFVQGHGIRTPFPDGAFDVVLLSEVLPALPEPLPLLREAVRVTRPGGRVIIVNPLDRPAIKRDYARRALLHRAVAALGGEVPPDHAAYVARLMASFGVPRGDTLEGSDYARLLEEAGLELAGSVEAPAAATQALYDRLQFVACCFGWPTVGRGWFALYPLLRLVDRVARGAGRPGGDGGCIMVARRRA